MSPQFYIFCCLLFISLRLAAFFFSFSHTDARQVSIFYETTQFVFSVFLERKRNGVATVCGVSKLLFFFQLRFASILLLKFHSLAVIKLYISYQYKFLILKITFIIKLKYNYTF